MRACERTTVADLLLDVGVDSTLRELRDGEDVSDGEGGLLVAVDEGVGGACSGRGRGKRRGRGVVDDDLDNAADVAIALCIVKVVELCRCYVVLPIDLKSWG